VDALEGICDQILFVISISLLKLLEHFFHVFNIILVEGKQIVITG